MSKIYDYFNKVYHYFIQQKEKEIFDTRKCINPNNKKYLLTPLVRKKELQDGKDYEILITEKNFYTNEIVCYWKIGKWIKKIDCFISRGSEFFKYDECLAVKEYNIKFNEYKVYNFDPTKINENDINEICQICFSANDQTESDDIWEKLIAYFDKRGIYPVDDDNDDGDNK